MNFIRMEETGIQVQDRYRIENINKKEGKHMKKIIIDKDNVDTIQYSQIDDTLPIFAKKDNVLCGMIVQEPGKGWILRLGGSSGATGFYGSLRECLSSCDRYEYEFYIV